VNDFMTAQMEATMSTIPLNPKDTAVLFVEHRTPGCRCQERSSRLDFEPPGFGR
jgi:hypothetical protein